jgi:hypothetical protein
MDRTQLLHALIMDAIANDYEPFDMIVQQVTTVASERGLVVNRNEIYIVLKELVDSGFAEAYDLSATSSNNGRILTAFEGAPDCYFLLTQKGKAAIVDY